MKSISFQILRDRLVTRIAQGQNHIPFEGDKIHTPIEFAEDASELFFIKIQQFQKIELKRGLTPSIFSFSESLHYVDKPPDRYRN